jgi:hypothetical protein
MVKKQKTNRTENEILEEINKKLDMLILLQSLQGKDKNQQANILKNYKGNLSKRELERITNIDRHLF